MQDLKNAIEDVRYLLDRGYPRRGAIYFVCDHYCLDLGARYLFSRVVYSKKTAASRRARTVSWEYIKGKEIWVDGYNILIGVESAFKGDPVFLCDDGFIRDTRGFFRNYRCSIETMNAIKEILKVLITGAPSQVFILFDAQISKSGELARWVNKKMIETGLSGRADTSKHVDLDLKSCNRTVATSDGSIIDTVESVVDIQGRILRDLHIRPQKIEEWMQ